MPKSYKDRNHSGRRNQDNNGGDKQHIRLAARLKAHAEDQKKSSRPITAPGSLKR